MTVRWLVQQNTADWESSAFWSSALSQVIWWPAPCQSTFLWANAIFILVRLSEELVLFLRSLPDLVGFYWFKLWGHLTYIYSAWISWYLWPRYYTLFHVNPKRQMILSIPHLLLKYGQNSCSQSSIRSDIIKLYSGDLSTW